MTTTFREGTPVARGRVRGRHVLTGQALPKSTALRRFRVTPWVPNLVLRGWGGLVGPLLTRGAAEYKIGGMLIEFVNVASPGDPAAVPTFDRDPASGLAYYNGLAGSPDRDYLRAPLIAATFDTTDEALYPDGNLMTFFATTSGEVGVHGLGFGEKFNSVVVGGALVAQVSSGDPTLDRVFSRFYFAEDEQLPKLATGQVGLDWEVELQ